MVSKVERFWAQDAENIRCVRESDYDTAVAELELHQSQAVQSKSEVQRLQVTLAEQTQQVETMAAEAEQRNAELVKMAAHIEASMATSKEQIGLLEEQIKAREAQAQEQAVQLSKLDDVRAMLGTARAYVLDLATTLENASASFQGDDLVDVKEQIAESRKFASKLRAATVNAQ